MRLTVADMENHGIWEKYRQCKIFLDDVHQHHCIVADEEAGYIEKFKINGDGSLMLNEQKTEVMTEKLYGIVRIEV